MAKKVLPKRAYPIIDELNGHAPTSRTLLVADTDMFCVETEFLMPAACRTDISRTYEIGVVTAVGSEVDDILPGDVILYRTHAAYRLPNGLLPAFMFKIDYPNSVIAVLGRDENYLKEAINAREEPKPVEKPTGIIITDA